MNRSTGREVEAQLLGVGSPLPVWFCEPCGWDLSHQVVVASAISNKSSCLSSLYFWMPCLILSLTFITVKQEKAICFFLVFYYFHFS